jgi:hypothetical protein
MVMDPSVTYLFSPSQRVDGVFQSSITIYWHTHAPNAPGPYMSIPMDYSVFRTPGMIGNLRGAFLFIARHS